MANSAGHIDLNDPRDLIAKSPMSAMQVLIVAITVALNALDGFDVASISFASPGIAEEWGIDRGALGIVLSMEVIGMAIGSMFLGGVADKIGRRWTVLGCTTIMALLHITVLVTLAYFFHITTFYFIVKWVPKIVTDFGFEASSAAGVLVWANVGGMFGGALLGALTQKFALRALTIANMLIATVMSLYSASRPMI